MSQWLESCVTLGPSQCTVVKPVLFLLALARFSSGRQRNEVLRASNRVGGGEGPLAFPFPLPHVNASPLFIALHAHIVFFCLRRDCFQEAIHHQSFTPQCRLVTEFSYPWVFGNEIIAILLLGRTMSPITGIGIYKEMERLGGISWISRISCLYVGLGPGNKLPTGYRKLLSKVRLGCPRA